MTRYNYTGFNRVFAGVVIALVGGIALFNVLVDPFEAYPTVHIGQLDRFRTQGETRIAKAEAYLRGRWDTVILGNSVAEGGWDPHSFAWGGGRVFNFALRGVPLPEMAEQLRFVLANGPPKEIVFGLTFNLLSDPRLHRFEFLDSRLNPQLTTLEYHLLNAIGLFSSQSSLAVIDGFVNDRVGKRHLHGFAIARDVPYVSRDLRGIFAGNWRAAAAPHFREGVESIAERIALFEQMVARCRLAGVDVTIVILPSHWTNYLAIHTLGWAPAYDQYVANMVEVASRVVPGSRGQVRVVSFAGVNQFTNESIPAGVEAIPLRWFHDPGHFTPRLGDLLIGDLMIKSPSRPRIGRVLGQMDVQAHLEELWARVGQQSMESPEEAMLVREALVK